MAGGTWTSQNKVLPGVYINVKTAPASQYTPGERGTVAICEPLSWGPASQILEIEAGADTFDLLGYDLNEAPQLLFLRQIFLGTDRTRGAQKVLLYRPQADSATTAKATLGTSSTLTTTAKYAGARGNDIAVSITADADNEGSFVVTTSVSGAVVDEQSVEELSALAENGWVTFSGTGTPEAAALTALTGGTDGTVQAAAYAAFLTALEPYTFDVLIYDGTDSTTQAAYKNFVERMRNDEGKKCQAVTAQYAAADSESVVSVYNGLALSDGTTLTPAQTCWWVGGATAGAKYNESLTYAKHPYAVDVSPRYSNSAMAEAITAGNLVLMEEFGEVKVVLDVNSLTTFTPERGEAFSKNRLIRAVDTIANEVYRTFSTQFIGRTDNNVYGRDLLKTSIIQLLNEMQANGGVQNFDAEDVTVSPGEAANAVVVTLAVQPVDAVEKIYITVTVE